MLESFEPPLLRTSVGTAEVNFSARHLAQNALIAFAAARALGLDIPERLDVRSRSGATRSCRCPAAACSSTTPGTRTRSRCAQRSSTCAFSPQAAAASPCSARWQSSAATATRRTARSRGRSPRSASTFSISVGERARVYGGAYAADADEALTLVRDELEPGDCVLVKGARVLGLERVADALAGVAA